jgi:hypothetical protein
MNIERLCTDTGGKPDGMLEWDQIDGGGEKYRKAIYSISGIVKSFKKLVENGTSIGYDTRDTWHGV